MVLIELQQNKTNELDIKTAQIMYDVFEKWNLNGNGVRATKHIDVAATAATVHVKTILLCINSQSKSPGQLLSPSILTFQNQNPYDNYLLKKEVKK